MQITTELDSQHWEKLQALKQSLQKESAELIALAIDELFVKNVGVTEGKNAYQLMQQSGFIGCMEGDGSFSENYKSYLDWSDKV
ncbi:hypothetical protein [Methylovulum psychrotolerans]|uniref:CopG family transcriptional regulator n=1 Tax=Methylovulum psychrotolerans TaxID=1704499 RepID=A0A1Z4BWJ1_9GAMM|nr:hypothetical protein [Methylovulum psychrotolerans]ASF45664.1 hypothetical protein CEK71_06030 [Methylovulum psychrotolerans]